MYVVRCRNPNSAERELIEALRGLDGVAFIGYMANSAEREREIDALVLTPVRAVVVEVKAPMMATPNVGELLPRLNAPWTIDGEVAQFYGGHSPNDQARVNAQVLAQLIKSKNIPKTPFIQSAVAVSGDELTMSNGPVMVGQTAVGLTKDVLKTLDLMRKKPIDLAMALDFIDGLDLGVLRPTDEVVEQEWVNFDDLAKTAEPRPAAKVAQVVKSAAAPYPAEEDKTLAQKLWTRFAELFSAFIAIFLLTFFLEYMGVIDYTKDGFSKLFLGDDTSEIQLPEQEQLPPESSSGEQSDQGLSSDVSEGGRPAQ